DPANADHLYVATIRGRGGIRRQTPPNPTPYGIWESSNGGVDWTARLTTTNQLNGATDLAIDPQNPSNLYATFWGLVNNPGSLSGIMKSTDGGQSWSPVMAGLPASADYTKGPTRFAIGISHPTATLSATLYLGFDYYTGSTHQ